jgi:hypothetical protein
MWTSLCPSCSITLLNSRHLSRLSVEAEYIGVANVVSKLCWRRNLLLEHHFLIHKTTLVHCNVWYISLVIMFNINTLSMLKRTFILFSKKLQVDKFVSFMFHRVIKFPTSSLKVFRAYYLRISETISSYGGDLPLRMQMCVRIWK